MAGDQFDDLDTDPVPGLRELEAARPGGTVVEVTGGLVTQGARMREHIRKLHDQDGVHYGDMAVLAPTNTATARWRDVLAGGEIPVIPLEDYAGKPREQVKVRRSTGRKDWSSFTCSSRTATAIRSPGSPTSLLTPTGSALNCSAGYCSWP